MAAALNRREAATVREVSRLIESRLRAKGTEPSRARVAMAVAGLFRGLEAGAEWDTGRARSEELADVHRHYQQTARFAALKPAGMIS